MNLLSSVTGVLPDEESETDWRSQRDPILRFNTLTVYRTYEKGWDKGRRWDITLHRGVRTTGGPEGTGRVCEVGVTKSVLE